ncbi:general substrate transporter [Venturia nashicola]|nr:general substrate transporter [Venturia nashicola]
MSSYCIGALIGCAVNFYLGDLFGRRRMMWLAMAFIVCGATLQTTAYTISHLIVGRIICGIGTGIDSSTVPMYQSELCEKEKRGRLVSWEVLFIGVGVVVAYWIDFGFSYLSGSVSWRTPIALQLVFAIVVVVLVWGLPESPRWLANRGREQEAVEVLCAVFDRTPNDPFIMEQVMEIREAISVERHAGAQKISGLFKNDRVKTRRRVILAWFMLFMNQLSGINIIIAYIPTVLVKSVGIDPKIATVMAGCVVVLFCIGALVPSLRLDHMGRRPAMMWGSAGLGICMMMVSILLSFHKRSTSIGAAAFFFLFMFVFGVSINAVPWVYGPEILPLVARTRGTAISVSSHWLWNFFILMITPTLLARLDWKTYLIFMATNFSFVPIVYFFYPETSNISLEQIDKLFIDAETDDGSMEAGEAGIGQSGKGGTDTKIEERQISSSRGKAQAR